MSRRIRSAQATGWVVLGLLMGCSRHEPRQEPATVVVNGAHDFGMGTPATAQGIVFRYAACPDITEALRLEAVSDAGVGALKPTDAQYACLSALAVGSTITVLLTTSRNRLSGRKSWSIDTVGGCDVSGLDGITSSRGAPCPWMGSGE